MQVIQHNHPISGTHYNRKPITEFMLPLGSCGASNGIGYVSMQLGKLIKHDPKCDRRLELRMTTHEARKVIDELRGLVDQAERYAAEQQARQSAAFSVR